MIKLRVARSARSGWFRSGWFLAGWLLGMWGSSLGCGTLGDGTAPQDLWPRTPLRGFVLRDESSPFVLLKSGFDLDNPTTEPGPMSASLRLFGQLSPRNQPQQSQIFVGTVRSLAEESAPEELLAPTLPWEGQGIANPMWLSGLPGEEPVMLYTTSDGAVGLFQRLRDGSLSRLRRPLIPAASFGMGKLGRVSPVLTDGTLRLYFTVDDKTVHYAAADARAVADFVSDDSRSVSFSVSPALLSASDVVISVTRSQTAVAERISGLFVRRVLTPAGRARYDLYARAEAMGKFALVAASSYQGDAREPFLVVSEPLLAATAGGVPSGPYVTQWNGQTLLLLGLRTVQTGVAVALLPSDLPKQP